MAQTTTVQVRGPRCGTTCGGCSGEPRQIECWNVRGEKLRVREGARGTITGETNVGQAEVGRSWSGVEPDRCGAAGRVGGPHRTGGDVVAARHRPRSDDDVGQCLCTRTVVR